MIRKTIILLLTLAALGTIALWAVTLTWSFTYWQARDGFTIGWGAIRIYRWHEVLPQGVELAERGWHVTRNTSGVIAIPKMEFRRGHVSGLDVPLWLPFLLFATYPTIAFIRGPLRRRRRHRKGLCVKCGYNLTGNVSGLCPECGEAA
jgi:4-amino-4-deoxy-L-arabinose transferase-like glycosyltransferase